MDCSLGLLVKPVVAVSSERQPFTLSSSAYPPNLISFQLSLISATSAPSLSVGITPVGYTIQKNHGQVVVCSSKPQPLKVVVFGAPASGKGTQCKFIANKYGLVHIAAGDLLRTEIASGSENGKQAKEYMEKGQLVPDEIVVTMVKDCLLQKDCQENGSLLDGYPRSLSQASALKNLGYQPDLLICLDVPEEVLVERVIGRRLDPLTGKIYHLKYFPPETEEIAARLTQRFDDTVEKAKLRFHTHCKNVEEVLSLYQDSFIKVDGSLSKEDVFAEIDYALRQLLDKKRLSLASNIEE